MTKRRYLLIFATSLSLAWLLHRGNQPAGRPDPFNNPRTKAVRTRERETSQTDKWRDFGKRSLGFSEEERGNFVKNLAPKDRAKAMEALAAQAGRNGLDPGLKSMMEGILRIWANEDFETAWSWSQRNSETASRRFIMEVLLDSLVAKDPDKALELYLQVKGEYPDFDSSVPFTLITAKTREGAGAFVDLFSKLPLGDGCSFGSMEFARDFDFQSAADGAATLMNGRENERPPAFPDNLFRQWATRDPESAYAWWAANGSLPDNDWCDLIIGVGKGSTPEAAAGWAADKLEEAAASREKIIRELTATTGRNERIIQQISEAMPDGAIRDRFLTDILLMSPSVDPTSTYEFAIPALSSPEARLSAFQKMREKKPSAEIGIISDAQLRQWQLSRSQLERIFTK
jgi:hypothetical protein